jgi:hypothetical protein
MAKVIWPETKVENLTKEQFDDLLGGSIGMTAFEVCEVMTKVKIVIRTLQANKTVSQDEAEIADVMITSFLHTLQDQYKPDEMAKLDEFFAKLLAYTVKSCTTPGSIVKLGKAAGVVH